MLDSSSLTTRPQSTQTWGGERPALDPRWTFAGGSIATEVSEKARTSGPIDTIQYGSFDPAEVLGFFASDDSDDR
jgi:hypothetical protein